MPTPARLPRRHRTRRILAGAAAVAAGALVLAGCGGSDAPTAAMPAVAKYAPADTMLYAQLDTNIRSAQWRELREMLGSWDAIEKGFDALADNAQAQEANELLGGELVLAVRTPAQTPTATDSLGESLGALGKGAQALGGANPLGSLATLTGANKAQVVLALDVTARGAAATKFTAELGKADATIAGAKTWTQDGMFIARTSDALVVSTDKAALTAALKGTGPSEAITAAVRAQPEGAMLAGAADATDLGDKALRAATATAGVTGFAVVPSGEAVTVTLGASGGQANEMTRFTPSLYATLPASTSVYIGFADLAGTVRRAVAQAKAEDATVAEQIDQVSALAPALLGVSWDDLAALTSGEHAFAAGGTAGANWAGLVLSVEDPTGAGTTLDALGKGLVRALRSQGQTVKAPVTLRFGATRLSAVDLDADDMWVAWGVIDGNAVLGIGTPKGLEDFANGERLGDNRAFAEGIAPAPEQVSGLVWVNPEAAATALGADKDYLTQLRRGLDGIVGWADGDRAELRLLRP